MRDNTEAQHSQAESKSERIISVPSLITNHIRYTLIPLEASKCTFPLFLPHPNGRPTSHVYISYLASGVIATFGFGTLGNIRNDGTHLVCQLP